MGLPPRHAGGDLSGILEQRPHIADPPGDAEGLLDLHRLRPDGPPEAAIWALPIVNFDAMLQAFRRDSKGSVNQLAYWSRPADCRNQTLTPNTDALYMLMDPAVPVPEWPLSPRGRERMTRALTLPWVAALRAVWCSTERKTRDRAGILAEHLGLPVAELARLGENDRSATGYLPRTEFEAVGDLFFAHPDESVRGWERAADAQRRILGAIEEVLTASADCDGDVAVVAHDGVGTLLLCQLRGDAIGRHCDQPPNNGGNYFAFDIAKPQVPPWLEAYRPRRSVPSAFSRAGR